MFDLGLGFVSVGGGWVRILALKRVGDDIEMAAPCKTRGCISDRVLVRRVETGVIPNLLRWKDSIFGMETVTRGFEI